MDFVYFIRQKTLQPELFKQEIQGIQQTLGLTHLREEWSEDYKTQVLGNWQGEDNLNDI